VVEIENKVHPLLQAMRELKEEGIVESIEHLTKQKLA
jgi:DNA-directed RNA polymerase subunit K/omega